MSKANMGPTSDATSQKDIETALLYCLQFKRQAVSGSYLVIRLIVVVIMNRLIRTTRWRLV